MKQYLVILILFAFVACNSSKQDLEINPSETLWYDEPANTWTEALPVGNGRLGAMVYGKASEEIIQFNEETLWTGQPHDYSHKGAHKYLDEMRQLLWAGKQKEAEKVGQEHFMSQPLRQMSYQPFGNILLQFPDHKKTKNYKRKLSLENAVVSINYKSKGTNFTREVFTSEPHQAIVINLNADKEGKINFNTSLNTLHEQFDISVVNNILILRGKADYYTTQARPKKNLPERKDSVNHLPSRMTFEARLQVINHGGELICTDKSIQVRKANSATLLLVAATNFVNYNDISGNPSIKCEKYINDLQGKTYQELKTAHIADYQELYKRVNLNLGSSQISNRPTDERLETFASDEDPSLIALLYQYGRYLLISSSRPGTQPANLQGIWNSELAPAWDSKYTLNINAEMNYWPAEICNLSELSEPFIKMVEDLTFSGAKVAKEHYNLPGWVAHHNTDIWRGTAPINASNHGIWPMGGAWACQHIWWHYQFTGDKEFLRYKGYNMMKGASKFMANYLVADKNNPEWLVSGPSNSPENGGLVMAPTMDLQIIRNLFSNTIEAGEILDTDAEFIEELKQLRDKIAPNQIGKHGQLQEWLEDKDNPENLHRHVSHLWGLHPGNEIHPFTTPELAEACKVTLLHRGDGGTGWSRAWKINFWARLLDGDHAFLLLKNLMLPAGTKSINYQGGGGLYANLFDAHPPFQIDGNFGATSGITEMLLQSHLRDSKGNYYQDILPALPSNLLDGSIKGVKGRGGFELSITWENGDLQKIEVFSLLGNTLNIRYKGFTLQQETEAGKSYVFDADDLEKPNLKITFKESLT